MKKLILIISIASCLLFACAGERPTNNGVENDKPLVVVDESKLVLALNKSVEYQGLSLEFMQMVGDSRCPKGVQCATQGNAQVVLLVSDKGTAQTLTLNTQDGGDYPNQIKFADKSIKLLSLAPYPATNIKIDPSQYKIQLEITQLDAGQETVIIDVRSEKEYLAGHYPGSINILYHQIDKEISSLNLAKDAEIIVYCRSGRRSGIAKEALDQLGYSNVSNGINQATLHKKLGTVEEM